MIELHLIGYTSDLRYLVLDLDPEGERGRYRLVVDGDLLLTLDELRDLRAQAGMDVGIAYERLEERLGIILDRGTSAPDEPSRTEVAGARPPEPVDDHALPEESVTARPPTSQPPPGSELEDEPPPTFRLIEESPGPEGREEDEGELREPGVIGQPEPFDQPGTPEPPDESREAEEPSEAVGGSGEVGGPREPDEPEDAEQPEDTDEPEEPDEREEPDEDGRQEEPSAAAASAAASGPDLPAGRESELSPAQIQARLRAGRRPESVAEEAGTDVAWVERWLPPILTERAQVLQEAQAMHLERPRKGRSGAPLAEAVAANLRRRHLDPEEDADWSVKRRVNGRWSINVRYRYRKKTRSATWALDRDEGELTASSKAARDLGWVDRA